MHDFEEFKKEQLKKPGVKAAYDALEEEYRLINEKIEARLKLLEVQKKKKVDKVS